MLTRPEWNDPNDPENRAIAKWKRIGECLMCAAAGAGFTIIVAAIGDMLS